MAGPSRPSKQSQDSPVPDAIPDDPLLNWDPDKILVEDNPYLGGYGDIGGLRASYQPSPGQIRFGSGRVLSSVGGGGPGGRGGGGGGSRSGVVPGLEHRLSQLLNDINTSSKNISHTHSFDDKNSINSKRSAQLTREQHLQEAQRVEDELKDIEARNREALRLIKYKTRLENEQRRRKHSRVAAVILSILAFIETIVVVVSITRPIPQFALDGNLFYLQSIEADKYSKRQFIPLNFTDFEDPSSIEPKLYGKNSREENNEEARHMILEDRSLHARQDTSDTKPKQVSTDKFVAFWFGVFGACLQRASGAIVCTDDNVKGILEQSRLPENVLATLPKSSGPAPAAFILGCILNLIFFVYLFLISIWPRLMWTPLDPSQSWEKRFRFILGSISFLTIGALAAFLGATAQLRKDFSQAVDSIPALDPDLIAKYDKAFDSLYAACIIGGTVVLGCLFLTWYSQEQDGMINPKWAKAAVTRAPMDGRWSHAGSIAAESPVGSTGSGQSPATHSTSGWR